MVITYLLDGDRQPLEGNAHLRGDAHLRVGSPCLSVRTPNLFNRDAQLKLWVGMHNLLSQKRSINRMNILLISVLEAVDIKAASAASAGSKMYFINL